MKNNTIPLTDPFTLVIDYTNPANVLTLTSNYAMQLAASQGEVLIFGYVPAAAIMGEVPDEP